ncbi:MULTISPECIES: sugar ABC transporter ATP-binding protein [unclassified Leisingera]|uniref:sugar ABC transporter ATP-binding protein n=1 Tax=unclassified Leisingera TaxID=2614906 RepID=UPI000304092F|nr:MULTISPECIES: sugar ABC transporter ATP-binding protein [unclassified Leisingera]
MRLEVKDLRKSYGPVAVLKGVDLRVEAGKVLAFLGANGAGKSTLLNCISGAQDADSGDILAGDASLRGASPRQVQDLGVAIIYQHFQVFEGLSVAENIFLGHEIKRGGRVDRRAQNAQARELLERLGVTGIDPRTDLGMLGVGERKVVEIARALRLKPKFLILDEPTASLSDKEAKALHSVIRQAVAKDGIGVIYVTHFLDEIPKVADQVTILRDGRILWTRPVDEVTIADMTDAISPDAMMHGLEKVPFSADGPAVLRLDALTTGFVGPVSAELRAGEVLGIYGLMGAGRTELLECLSGAAPKTGGRVELDGREVSFTAPRDALSKGVALVASDRKEQSLFASFPAVENLLVPHFGRSPMPKLLRSFQREGREFERAARRLNIQPPNPRLQGQRFSGGNAQKIMVGRWLVEGSGLKLLLLDEPTQGVDIGARHELYEALAEVKRKGTAVAVASSDATEICLLADKILVLGRGKQVALIDNPHDEELLIELAHRAEHSTQQELPASGAGAQQMEMMQ